MKSFRLFAVGFLFALTAAAVAQTGGRVAEVNTDTLYAVNANISGNLTVAGAGGVTSGTLEATFDIGCTVDPVLTTNWTVAGNIVTLHFADNISCTGNATTMTAAAGTLPLAIRPTGTRRAFQNILDVTDNGAGVTACFDVLSDGGMAFVRGNWSACASSWVASGARAINPQTFTFTYSIQ